MDRDALQAPPLILDDAKLRAFRTAWGGAPVAAPRSVVAPPAGWPVHEYLRWLVEAEPILLHGSNHGTIDTFVPRWQMDYQARFRKGIWATADGIWPLFFAIVDRRGYEGTLRNGCWWEAVPGGGRRKLYRFSLNAAMLQRGPWTTGTVYILPRESFRPIIDDHGLPLEEWISEQPVRPIACVSVGPTDFPFLDQVQGHDETVPTPPAEWPVVDVAPEALDRLVGMYALDPDMALIVTRVNGRLALAAKTGSLKTNLWPAADGWFVSRDLDLQVVFGADGLVLRLLGRETPFPKVP